MKVEIQNNKDDNTRMSYVNDIHKKEREVTNKCLQIEKSKTK